MTLRHYKIFLEVYQTGNMTIAAKNLYMTQPSVSQAIKELETFYHQKLFERLSQKLYITDAGNLLFQYANQIISLHEEANKHLITQKDYQTLRIGGNYTVGLQMLGNYIKKYKQMDDSLEISVIINKAPIIRQLIKENKLDLALIEESTSDQDYLIQLPFYQDKIVAVVSPKHPLTQKGAVSLAELYTEPFLIREKGVGARELFEAVMRIHGYQLIPAWESISATALIHACKNMAGIAILPYEAVRLSLEQKELTALTITDVDLSRNLVIAYHKDKFIFHQMQQFIELIQNDNKGE